MIGSSDKYSDTSGSLRKFKKDEVPNNNADLAADNSQSFKYKVMRKTANAVNNPNSFVKNAKIVVPLKYLINFWRLLETPLISCKVHLELNRIEDWILSSAANPEKFKIIDAKLHFPIVTLSTKKM